MLIWRNENHASLSMRVDANPRGSTTVYNRLVVARVSALFSLVDECCSTSYSPLTLSRSPFPSSTMDNDPPSVAEQRANAVAKLRRAASLPRMKDGRRPPMHIEAVSDGEKLHQEDEQDVVEPTNDRPSTPVPRPDSPPQHKPATPEPPSGRKRRSRSRSRSRGSRDFKAKKSQPVTPTNDSSPEDSPPSTPAVLPTTPVLAPIPSHFSTPPQSRVLMSPNFLSPGTPLLYPGTSPPTPLMPTLDAIQKGLLRSNSVAARMQALHKLTGGNLESHDPTFPSPSISPQPALAKLARNNTISGGERSAARMKLFTALGERIKEADEGGTSAGEDRPVVSTPAKRRRRRSGRNSTNKSDHVTPTEDSELLSTSTSTPTHSSTPLPFTQQPLTERTASTTPIPVQPISNSNINPDENSSRQTAPVRAVHNQWKRRSIVVEQDDDSPHFTHPDLPPTPSRSSPGLTQRLPHSPDAPLIEPSLPLYLSVTQRSPSRQDPFSSSPFATPHKEVSSFRDEGDDTEQVVYPAERNSLDRQISWIAEPGLSFSHPFLHDRHAHVPSSGVQHSCPQ